MSRGDIGKTPGWKYLLGNYQFMVVFTVFIKLVFEAKGSGNHLSSEGRMNKFERSE